MLWQNNGVKNMKRSPLKKSSSSEKVLQKQILDWLRWNKYIAVKFHSSIFVGKKGKEGRFIRSPQVGISDILFCSPQGRFGAIEVKSAVGVPSREQIEFLAEVNKRGGVGILARSLKDVEQGLKKLKM